MIGRRGFLGAAAAVGLAGRGASARDARPGLEADEPVNRVLGQARTDGRRLPGMVGGIVRGEALASIGAVGVRKVGSPEPMRVDDLVHVGSCTKAMTATMIGTLVDEGKLRWASTVGESFPEWAGEIHPDHAAITLDQLLRHRAGLAHDFPWRSGGPGLSTVERRRAILARALREAPASRPGATYAYSNAGYVLAGMMAEQAGGQSWEALMGRRVFGPLGMASAGFGPPGTPGRVDQPWGHRAEGDTVTAVYLDNAPAMGPAGTVHCSLADWARFAAFHLRGRLGDVALLKPDTLKALHAPRPGEEYAGGWIACERSWAGGRALTHSGSNTFWFCTVWLAPARNFAILVATNAAGKPAEQACDQAIAGLTRLATLDDRPTPKPKPGPRRR